MALIKSVSGIRGTIGGKPGNNLTPQDLVGFTTAFAQLIKKNTQKEKIRIVVGRDARISGGTVAQIVIGTLSACAADVVDIGLATTPTTEHAVCNLEADGGIILTASHNPREWNALKLLNSEGEFLSAAQGEELLQIMSRLSDEANYASVDNLGVIDKNENMLNRHVEKILAHELVDKDSVRSRNFKIVVDGINSVGGFAIPYILRELGVHDIVVLNGEPNGEFAHNPEPLPEHLSEIIERVKFEKADLGIVVDPDADRLAFVCENASLFGEEYTLVAVADYILQNKKGAVVSNLSSSRALRDIAKKHGVEYYASAVGEVNVVEEMKKRRAVIGGEGNGGVIFPEMHYGRDALAGTALFLSLLATCGKTCSELRAAYPKYKMIKSKIALQHNAPLDEILKNVKTHFENQDDVKITDIDGVKIDFPNSWVHLRKSNTEPVIRIYAEAACEQQAHEIAQKIEHFVSDSL